MGESDHKWPGGHCMQCASERGSDLRVCTGETHDVVNMSWTLTAVLSIQ